MSADKFLNKLGEVMQKFEDTQMDAIDQAAEWVADAVEAERFGVLFGTGHSYMAASDPFPRIGSYPAWLPIHEISTSYVASISGNLGIRQGIFLEKVHGFGDVILENYRLDPHDVMIVISNSGVNALPIDIALNAKRQGLRTVAVTSWAHSSASESRHESGKRLFEVCDLMIDTCMPQGDALVEVQGLGAKVAAASTIMSLVVMHSLSAQLAPKLVERNIDLPVYPSHNTKMTTEEHERVEGMAEAVMKEYARRTANIYR
jgi:uncharacterized phosphosugar-binding protein